MTAAEQPFRDNGPYIDRRQALAQLEAQLRGFPAQIVASHGVLTLLQEALMLAGLTSTGYELRQLEGLSPEQAVIVAGMLVRARLYAAPGTG